MSYYPPPQQPGYGHHGHHQPPPQQQYYGQPPPQPGHYPPPQQQPYGAPPAPYGAPPNPQGHPTPHTQYPPGPGGYGQHPPPPSQYPPSNQYPPPSGYPQGPPPSQYGAPAPYGQPPAPQHGYPQQGYPPPQQYGAPPPQHGQHGQHGAPPGHGAAPGHGAPPPPMPPSGSAYMNPPDPANVRRQIEVIYKAMKGFGTDEKALIKALAPQDGPTIDAIRQQYSHGNLIQKLEGEVSKYFGIAVVSTAWGPTGSAAYFANFAIKGAGTKESILTEAIMGKSNAELTSIKSIYQQVYRRPLVGDVKGDLSQKTEDLFVMALDGRRPDEWVQPNPQQASHDASTIYTAFRGVGTDQRPVCELLTRSNDAQIRAIAYEFERAHGPLAQAIKKEFSGHMKDALLYLVEGAQDKAKRDARLLEEAMAGFGTKDELLISRVVRIHWDRMHLEAVKAAYKHMYHKDLARRIEGETSGDYRDMLVALIR